ncbi:guanylate kinase [Arcobacter sp. 15-2]|uniref:guanylate kinase n=1 Tax=Arcobacter sp. 15-2 TaxID=3374109 RepID=UPI00399D5352
MNNLYTKGAILLLSGPSGCGKSSLLKEVYKIINNYHFSISTTTREPRIGEKHGVDYYFVTKDEFEKDIKNGDFLEWAEVHGNYYGTSLKPINQALKESKLVIFDIDVQGFEQVITKLRDITTTVFITTPTIKELENRLYTRNTDSKEVIEKRISNAKAEIEYIDQYDYFIVNDDLKIASEQLVSIARSSLVKASLYNKEEIIKNWNK